MALEGAEGGRLLWSLLVLCMKAKSPPSPLMPETLFDHVPLARGVPGGGVPLGPRCNHPTVRQSWILSNPLDKPNC